MKKSIAKVVVGLPIDYAFDYLVGDDFHGKIKVGCRVRVPFTNKKLVGYVVGMESESRLKNLKKLISLLDDEPVLDKEDLKFLKEFSQLYCCSLGEAIEAALPAPLKEAKPLKLINYAQKLKEDANPYFILIHDISCYKRWDIFFEKIKEYLSLNGSVIFLVPEASNIAIAAKKIKERFVNEEIAVFNRRLSPKIQVAEWLKAKNGIARIVIGTRSAIFAPLKNLKLIIIDEEDNASYKQEQSPFYHAREVAILRAKLIKASVILASATSSLEAYYLAKKNKFKFIALADEKKSAEFKIVDTARISYEQRRRKAILSFALEDNIRNILSESGKVILFINRKGFSSIIRCRKCNFTLKCKRCNVSLTYHFDKKKLVCRFCNYKIDPPQLCPQCKESYMRYSGAGAEKLESEISRIFPGKSLVRMDRETGKESDKADIIIATQIILKSYSTVFADLVGVVDIDSSLNRFDFRAAEKTFSLLTKLGLLARKKIIVQTHNPQHYSIFSAAHNDFNHFCKEELKLRRSLGFPPFRHFISVGLRGKNLEKVKELSNSIFKNLTQLNKSKDLKIYEPMPDIPDKLRGNYRLHILLNCKDVKVTNKLIKNVIRNSGRKSGIITSINVDI